MKGPFLLFISSIAMMFICVVVIFYFIIFQTVKFRRDSIDSKRNKIISDNVFLEQCMDIPKKAIYTATIEQITDFNRNFINLLVNYDKLIPINQMSELIGYILTNHYSKNPKTIAEFDTDEKFQLIINKIFNNKLVELKLSKPVEEVFCMPDLI